MTIAGQMIALIAAVGLLVFLLSRRAPTLGQVLALVTSVLALAWVGSWVAHGPVVSLEPAFGWARGLAPFLRLDLRMGALEPVLRRTRAGDLGAVGAALFTALSCLYNLVALRGHGERGRVAGFSLWTLAAALTVFWADNLLLMVLAWEVLTLMLYLMVNAEAEGALPAQKSYAILGASDLAMLVAVAFLVAIGRVKGTALSESKVFVTSPGIAVAYLLLVCAALAKAGAWPLHTWLPPVATAAPASVSALLPASLDKLLGIYLLARISLGLFVLPTWMKVTLMVAGGVTTLAAVIMGMMQHNLKRLLGFHAVSQVGYMVLGIGTGTALGVAGGLFHMVNHALYKSGLFLMAGTVERARGSAELDDLGGLARRLPWTFGCAVVFALAISGVPPLNGFASKWLVYQACLSVGGFLGPLLFTVAVFASALTLASFVKVLHSVFWGPEPEASRQRQEPAAMVLPMVIIALLCVVAGVWAGATLRVAVEPAARELGVSLPPVEPSNLGFQTGWWNPGLAAVLLAVAAFLGWVLYAVGRPAPPRVVDAFVAGERFGANPPFFSGTHFYAGLMRLPVLGSVVREAEAGVFDLYRWAEVLGQVVVNALRAVHTGLLNLYVSWALLGLAVVVLVLST